MEALQDMDEKIMEERKLFDNVFELLSYEKITFNGQWLFRFMMFCYCLQRDLKVEFDVFWENISTIETYLRTRKIQ